MSRAEPDTSRSAWIAALSVAGLHTALRLWIILGRGMSGPGASDERHFHLPVIRAFAEQWPAPDLSDYLAASTPGYHLAMVGVSALTGGALTPMRLVSGTTVTLTLAILAWFAARRVGVLGAIALCTPLMTSAYLLGASTLLLPEGAAWALLVLLLLLALRPRIGWRTYALGGLLVLLTVLTRQIFLWTAGLLWLAAWLGEETDRGTPAEILPARASWKLRQRIPRVLLALGATLPAIGAIGAFVWLWQGLTPPLFRAGGGAEMELAGTHTGVNPSVVLLTLALLALGTPFIAGYLVGPLRNAWTDRRHLLMRALTIGAGGGMLLALLIPSSFSREGGRYSGLWNAIARAPAPMDRSPLMLALAPLGGVCLAAIWVCLPRRAGWIVTGAVAGFAVAQSANHQAWQRYVEPMALITLLLGAALVWQPRDDRPPGWAFLGPLVLGALLALVSLSRVTG
ncbi:MAG: hypothetical protein ACIARR_04115 [Phycisphaerales bacterium JB059]